MNEVKNRWNTFRIKETSQGTDIWFNELYNLNLKLKKTKEKYEKYEDEMKEHVFDVLSEEYKPVRLSCNVKISNMHTRTSRKKSVGSG